LPLAPARLEGAEVLLRPDGFRLLVHLRALSPVRALTGPIALRIDYLDRYVASLRLLHHLGRHLQGVSAFFDVRPGEAQRGRACEIAIGAAPTGAVKSLNPLERLRLLLHYPELELYLHVSVPTGHKPWTRLVLAFDLDSKWPDSRAIASEPFQLHAVPVVNLRKAPAAVIAHDGLRLDHPILPNEVHRDCVLHSVAGVFELKQEGLSPLPPVVLPGSDEGYEIDRVEQAGGPKHRLRLRLRDAFAKPRNVVVQAEWHQPWFAGRAIGPLTAWLPNRHLDAAKWRVLGGVRAAVETPVYDMSSGLLELLAMRMKPTLSRAELVLLLQLLGAGADSPFAPLLAKIRTFTVEVSPDGGVLGGGVRYRYRLKFDAVAPADEAVAWTLVTRIRELCDAWTVGAAVSVEVEMDTTEEPSRGRALVGKPASGEEK
jgi:hypothetical protein